MNRLFMLIVCEILILGLAGCHKPCEVNGVSVDSANKFPEFLVGTWKADKHDWAVVFASDGSISSVVHTLWALPISVEEGGVYLEGKEPGTFALFVIGECEASYNPTTRELSSRIILDAFEINMPNTNYKGKSEDHFVGPVSEDGKTWSVEWRGYGYLEDASPPDVNYIDANPELLVFSKIDAN